MQSPSSQQKLNLFTQFYDPYPLRSTSFSADKNEPSSLSDASSSAPSRPAHSDEDVMLATSYPKKRAGRIIFKETRHPIFRGVRKRKKDRWVCELRELNKKSRIWLDSAWRLPMPVSKEAKDIRKAAYQAAEMFRLQEFGGEVTMQNSPPNPGVEDAGEVSSTVQKHDSVTCVDEEAVFDMPGLLEDMAKGLLLSPLHYVGDDSLNWDDSEPADIDVSLWSFSI
ncbi:dehydration-responsive element-binding protein 1E isoform X2 [Hevea brasiliensis]|uniref:dehydration-responsive element-binding protein 1E isoform X2 n=1 Tax=Hevea brasiliensis TaxID=3981 RepID=UPI000B7758EC|nr:dehydration-responsive element-binding protein 1E isoform X2 [Hevea brasiliensis]